MQNPNFIDASWEATYDQLTKMRQSTSKEHGNAPVTMVYAVSHDLNADLFTTWEAARARDLEEKSGQLSTVHFRRYTLSDQLPERKHRDWVATACDMPDLVMLLRQGPEDRPCVHLLVIDISFGTAAVGHVESWLRTEHKLREAHPDNNVTMIVTDLGWGQSLGGSPIRLLVEGRAQPTHYKLRWDMGAKRASRGGMGCG